MTGQSGQFQLKTIVDIRDSGEPVIFVIRYLIENFIGMVNQILVSF